MTMLKTAAGGGGRGKGRVPVGNDKRNCYNLGPLLAAEATDETTDYLFSRRGLSDRDAITLPTRLPFQDRSNKISFLPVFPEFLQTTRKPMYHLPVLDQHSIHRDRVGAVALAILHVLALVQPELRADYVFSRWDLGHVEPEPLPTFMPHPGDVMIYVKLQVCDQFRNHSRSDRANDGDHANERRLTHPHVRCARARRIPDRAIILSRSAANKKKNKKKTA